MPRISSLTLSAAALAGLLACANVQPALTPAPTPPQTDAALQAKLTALVQGFHGDVGVYAWNLRTGQSAAIRANEVFPTASMIKVPILIATFQAMENGGTHLPPEAALHRLAGLFGRGRPAGARAGQLAGRARPRWRC